MTGRRRREQFLVRALAVVVAAAAMGVAGGVPAYAPHVAQLQVTPSAAKAGDTVTVYGPRGYGPTNPVEVRWGSPTGPVLGTFAPSTESYAQFGPGTIVVPADAKPGIYQLWATQQLTPGETYIRGIPSQATFQVNGPGGLPAVGQGQVASTPPNVGLQEHNSTSGTHLAVIAFGVAGIALFLGGAVAIALGRRPSPAATAEAAK